MAFKEVSHEETYHDAVAAVIRDQEDMGLDIVTDGNMWYDDYVGVIGSFCWYMYERIGGFEHVARGAPVARSGRPKSAGKDILDDWGGVINSGPVTHGPISPGRSVQDCRGAVEQAGQGVGRRRPGQPGVARATSSHYKNAKELSFALAPIFNKEMKDLVAAGAKYLQFEDLGAWLPLFTNNKDDYKWIRESVEQCCDGVDAKIGWHFCFGNAWGNDILSANFPQGYQTVLPHFFGTAGIDEFVLDYANRHMDGVDFLKNLPANQGVQLGVLDIRTNAIEPASKIADRIRHGAQAQSRRSKITLSSDCGMKPLARMVAKMKLNSLRSRGDRPAERVVAAKEIDDDG